MGLDRDDLKYFDTKFGEVHSRITHESKELTAMITNVDKKLGEHIAAPCKDVAEHLKEKHNTLKTVGLLGSIAGVAAAAWEGVKWLVSHASKGGN